VSGSTSRDEETRESRSIKIKPSILLKAHIEAVQEGKSLGWWVEEAISEKIEREEKKVK
jgi:predicted HicB family RNase H-like nuclease